MLEQMRKENQLNFITELVTNDPRMSLYTRGRRDYAIV
jgi:hypothetical protein